MAFIIIYIILLLALIYTTVRWVIIRFGNKPTLCKTCEKMIAESARICVHCGADRRTPFFLSPLFYLILIVVTYRVQLYIETAYALNDLFKGL